MDASETDYLRVHDAVAGLVREYGVNVVRDVERFKAILADLAADCPQPCRAVMAAVDAGVLADLVERRELTEAEVGVLAGTVANGDAGDAVWAVHVLAAACRVPIVPVGSARLATVTDRVAAPTSQPSSTWRYPGPDPNQPPAPDGRSSGRGRVVALAVGAGVVLVGVVVGLAVLGGHPSETHPRQEPLKAPQVVTTVVVGRAPGQVALSPDNKRAYVTMTGFDDEPPQSSVSVIDTDNNTVTDTITVGQRPSGVVVSPDGRRVYVANEGQKDLGNSVSVIDTASNAVIATVAVGLGPSGVAVSPDGHYVYVADTNVSVIDTATNTVVATAALGQDPVQVAVSPDGRHVYATTVAQGATPGGVSVIDTATNTVTAVIGVGWGPKGVAAAPDGRHVYVANWGHDPASGSSVSVVDTATNTVTATTNVGQDPFGVAVSPDGSRVYVANRGADDTHGNTVSVIDTASNAVTTTLTVAEEPLDVAVSPDGRRAYVANYQSSSVSVIDTGVG